MSADFVAPMEDVPDLDAEPQDPRRPVVCLAATTTLSLADTKAPLPARRERPEPESCEYLNGDTHNLSLTYRPKAGWRHVPIAHRRTIQDVAHRIRRLEDEACP